MNCFREVFRGCFQGSADLGRQWDRHLMTASAVQAPRSGGGGTPLYGLYRYVRPQRVGFFGRFGHK